jgi:AcrR family transcriptional regulator
MQPENETHNQQAQRSFIEQARRAQIIEATIDVLAEQGQGNASFVRIAQHAGISPSLISYHFKNKEELWGEVLASIIVARVAYVTEHIARASTAAAKLRAALEADLIYMGTRPKLFAALVEVFFSMRNSKGRVAHLDDDDDGDLQTLIAIFQAGQQSGEFGAFDPIILAHILAGAKDRFLAQLLRRPDLDLEVFTQTLVGLALAATRKEQP